MIIRLWGVRGSTATPLATDSIKRKIEEVIAKVQPSDLVSGERRRSFLSNLSPSLFGTIGGNTACTEIETADGGSIIMDAGTGLREFGESNYHLKKMGGKYHIFLSHFHYDHILGIPYFPAVYDPSATIHFYSPYPKMKDILFRFLARPYHPVGWESFQAKIYFHTLERKEITKIGNVGIEWIKRTHPDGSMAYKITEDGKTFIYSTDTQLSDLDFQKTQRMSEFFENAEAIILDAQYTRDEAIAKYDWGHSSYSLAVDFAQAYSIKKLLLFHHDPLKTDSELEDILHMARLYHEEHKPKTDNNLPLEINLAREGYVFEI